MKKIIIIILVLGVLAPSTLYAQQGNNAGLARKVSTCMSGLRQFMAAGIGYEGFTDYFRDFKLWPVHYADVAALQQKVNKARYAVVASFLRCDKDRLQIVSDQYYKLEAELYYVRFYVDTQGDSLVNRTKTFEDREKFIQDMTKFYLLRKKSQDPEQDKAIISGYFDEFLKKYEEKAKTYAGFGKDPVYKDLGAKFDELINTFKGLSKIKSGLTSDKPKETKPKKDKNSTNTSAGPKKTVKERAAQIFGKLFNACVTTENDRYCISGPSAAKKPKEKKKPKTFEDVMISVQAQQLKKTKDLNKVEMLTRYELLYGDVSGGGMGEILDKLDLLKASITKGTEGDPKKGSYNPLDQVNKCAENVLKKHCK